MKGSAICLLFLWQAAVGASTNAQYYFDKGGNGDDHGEPNRPQTDLAPGVETNIPLQPGAEHVDSALFELKKVPRLPYKNRRQTGGLISALGRLILKTLPTTPARGPAQQRQPTKASGPVAAAVVHLEQAAQFNNSDALCLLAELNFFGYHNHPRNLQTAFDRYYQLATSHGNTTAQYMLGLYYSTGIGNVVPQDQAKALLYYTFAAAKGNTRAEMATAFRHHSGVGAAKNCETALKYYKGVADKAIEWYRSGPPGGEAWIYQAWRIADEDGGVYGEGASFSSAGFNAIRRSLNSDANADIGDVIEYLDLMSQKGDLKASFNLGRIYYEGQRSLEQNFELALKYFRAAASKFLKKDGRANDASKNGGDKPAAEAAGYLGRMYMRGDGVTQNFEQARAWFERGKTHGDAQSQYGLGLMLLNGYGGRQNVKLAMELLRSAAEQDFAPAQVQMGRLHLDQGRQEDLLVANNHFELAARYGNIESYYYLGEMINFGVGRERQCSLALGYYKSVAERAEPFVSSWAEANDAYEAGNYDLALLEYLMAAEQGYEKAQTNVAFMLDTKQTSLPPLGWFSGNSEDQSGLLSNPKLALIEWTRSSRQSNVDSLVKMGDYYFHGIGTEPDIPKAVQCYTGASDYSQSAQAMFNLGWMHENGVGLKQDFHLAKRYYDHALEINKEAYLPVTLSLLKLRVRSAWNTLTNGSIHSIQDEPNKKKDWSLSEWINNFLDADHILYEEDLYEDMYDGTEILDDEEDSLAAGIIESLLIVGITMTLVFLIWWRQRIQQARNDIDDDWREGDRGQQQRQQQQQQQQQARAANNLQLLERLGFPQNGAIM